MLLYSLQRQGKEGHPYVGHPTFGMSSVTRCLKGGYKGLDWVTSPPPPHFELTYKKNILEASFQLTYFGDQTMNSHPPPLCKILDPPLLSYSVDQRGLYHRITRGSRQNEQLALRPSPQRHVWPRFTEGSYPRWKGYPSTRATHFFLNFFAKPVGPFT